MKEAKCFGQQVRELRESLGLTQAEFAEKVSLHYMTIVRWEKLAKQPYSLQAERFIERARELGAEM